MRVTAGVSNTAVLYMNGAEKYLSLMPPRGHRRFYHRNHWIPAQERPLQERNSKSSVNHSASFYQLCDLQFPASTQRIAAPSRNSERSGCSLLI